MTEESVFDRLKREDEEQAARDEAERRAILESAKKPSRSYFSEDVVRDLMDASLDVPSVVDEIAPVDASKLSGNVSSDGAIVDDVASSDVVDGLNDIADEDVFEDGFFDESQFIDDFEFAELDDEDWSDDEADANADVIDHLIEEDVNIAEEVEYQKNLKEFESDPDNPYVVRANTDYSYLDSIVSGAAYPSRNPEPMSADDVELREDRPNVLRSEHVKASPPEPLRYSSSGTAIKMPQELIDHIRAIVIETLQSTVVRLDDRQLKYVRNRVGSEDFAKMTDSQRIDSWIKYTGETFAANRIVTAFVAAQANLDITGLDETTELIVKALRQSDPTLREMHTISAKLDVLNKSSEKSRSLIANSSQTLHGIELAVSFIIAYFIPGGYMDLKGESPKSINISRREARLVRDNLITQTKREIVNLRASEGRPMGRSD